MIAPSLKGELSMITAQKNGTRFAQVDDTAALVTEGCFMAKIDIQSAYQHVPISKHSQWVTRLRWQFGNKTVYLRDTELPFLNQQMGENDKRNDFMINFS